MSGLVKAKKYDWKDSNLALFGSDLEKNVKAAAAKTEKAWEGAGEEVGLKIWRIEKFKVKSWPEEDYGSFYSGDSYIILNTYKDKQSDELLYDVHFWIGQYSTQDEYGTAAYKTVELDTFLNDKPIQHREVMGHESELFQSYFETLTTMKGGSDSGFKKVTPEEYKARLLKFDDMGKNQVKMTEVTYCKECVTADNVYVIDMGLHAYQVNGSNSDKDERIKAVQYVQSLKSKRGGKLEVEVIDETSQIVKRLPSGDPSQDNDDENEDADFEPCMKKLSDESGQLKFTDVSGLSKDKLESQDVFIVDTGKAAFVWIGKEASVDERKKGVEWAHNYLMNTKHPFVTVAVVREGQKSEMFEGIF